MRLFSAVCLAALVAPAYVSAQELPSAPVSLAGGRLVVGTDVSLSATPQSDNQAWFDYTDYSHDALRMLRAGITAALRPNDRASFVVDVPTENGDAIRPYALYVRVRPWTSRAIDLQA